MFEIPIFVLSIQVQCTKLYCIFNICFENMLDRINFKKMIKRECETFQSESANRRTDNTMAKRKSTKGQTMIYKIYI
jgi:hypothetical protein